MTEGPGAADAPRTFLEAPSDPQARYPAAQAWMNARLLPLPRSALVQRLLVPFALALGSMAFALALVRAHPAMYWYDPYGRVAFRDHLALGRWLPLLQVVVYAVIPQVISRATGIAIYRLDANVRHSTVIGIVGAGGIGQTLSASFSRYEHDFAAAILLSIIALVALGEWFSDWVRRRMR